MRDILFKGKRTDNGEWVYGFLVMDKYLSVKNEEALYITKPNIIILGRIGEADYDGDGNYYKYEVAPETVGQYTGLTDKNGIKIFEGDIVEMPAYAGGKHKTVVYFKNGKFAVDGSNYAFKDICPKRMKVIGNNAKRV